MIPVRGGCEHDRVPEPRAEHWRIARKGKDMGNWFYMTCWQPVTERGFLGPFTCGGLRFHRPEEGGNRDATGEALKRPGEDAGWQVKVLLLGVSMVPLGGPYASWLGGVFNLKLCLENVANTNTEAIPFSFAGQGTQGLVCHFNWVFKVFEHVIPAIQQKVIVWSQEAIGTKAKMETEEA